MASFGNIAERVFNVLKGSGKKIGLYDKEGNSTIDPTDARRMFLYDNNIMVGLHEDGENSELTIYLPESIDMTDEQAKDIINSLRTTAIHYNVQFTIKKFGKEIKPKDFAFATESIQRSKEMKIEEATNPLVGSSRKSTQQWNEARLVIKHNKPVAEDVKGSRARNINKIFIETHEGERFKFPNTHLQGARSMARHVGAGGAFHDSVGQHIVGLSEEYRNLSTVSNYVNKNKSGLSESALDIRDTSRGRMAEIRESLHQFMTKRGYATKIDEIANIEAAPLNEENLAETVASLCTTLNISEDDETMNAAITSVAPLIKEDTLTEYAEEGGFDVNTIIKATGGFDKDNLKAYQAAAGLLTTLDFKWLPKVEDTEFMQHTALSKLSSRLNAMAHRLDFSVLGQDVLSNILLSIVDKIDNTEGGSKVSVSQAQKDIVDTFLKVAPLINESMIASGYGDWDIIKEEVEEVDEVAPLPTEKQKATTKRIKDRMKKKDECKESRDLDEWFEDFDPIKIMTEDEVDEACDCGEECECDCEGECGEDCKCNEANKIDESTLTENNHKPGCGCPFCNPSKDPIDKDSDEKDEDEDETVTEASEEEIDEESEEEKTTESEVQKMLNKGLIESDMENSTDTMRDIMNAMTESKEEVDEDEEDTIDESIIEEFNEIQEEAEKIEEVDELDESACNEEMFDCDGKQKAMFSEDEPAKDTSGDNDKGLTPMFPFESDDMNALLKNAGMQINEVREQEVVFEEDSDGLSRMRDDELLKLWVKDKTDVVRREMERRGFPIAEGEERHPFKVGDEVSLKYPFADRVETQRVYEIIELNGDIARLDNGRTVDLINIRKAKSIQEDTTPFDQFDELEMSIITAAQEGETIEALADAHFMDVTEVVSLLDRFDQAAKEPYNAANFEQPLDRPYMESDDSDDEDDEYDRVVRHDRGKHMKKMINRKKRKEGGMGDQIAASKESLKIQKYY